MKFLKLLPLVFFVAGCTGGASTEELSIPEPTRQQAIDLIYNTAYQTPAGFYTDLPDTSRSYSLYHVKDSGDDYELCTDDPNEALTLEANEAIGGVFVESSETDRYFQITRELDVSGSVGNTGLTEPGFARVYKCNYINRTGVDRNNPNGPGGTLNGDLEQFVQYNWGFTFWWPRTAKVLQFYSDENAHTLLLGLAERQTNDCDLIQILEWRWTQDSVTGELVRNLYSVDRFEAEVVNGVPAVCS